MSDDGLLLEDNASSSSGELLLEENDESSDGLLLEENGETESDDGLQLEENDVQLEDNGLRPSFDPGRRPPAGQRVQLQALKAKPSLNGATGTVLRYVPASDRWAVLIDGSEEMAIKLSNLAVVAADDDSDGSLQLEENDDELMLAGGDSDDGLQLEENGGDAQASALELPPPPQLPEEESARVVSESRLEAVSAERLNRGTSLMLACGISGSARQPQADIVEWLAEHAAERAEASPFEEHLLPALRGAPTDSAELYGACHRRARAARTLQPSRASRAAPHGPGLAPVAQALRRAHGAAAR
jgi:hypothetical protein